MDIFKKISKKLLTNRRKYGKIDRQRRRTLRSHRAARGEHRFDKQAYHGRICVGVYCVRGLVFAQFFLLFCKNGGVFNISTKELMINEEIKAKEVRVIGVDGEAIGVMSSDDALKLAYDKGYDLVLMAPQAQPPVCRIMDYGKYRFERDKKEKEAKKKQQVVETKEIQLSCRIDVNDFNTKVNHATKFLRSGDKVKVSIRFRGREMAHAENGNGIMDRFAEACAEVGTVEKPAKLEGRSMLMFLVPKTTK